MSTAVHDASSVRFHLTALERRFGASPAMHVRIANAAARGARRGRRNMRWDLASVAVGVFFALAFVTGGSMVLQSADSVQRTLADAER